MFHKKKIERLQFIKVSSESPDIVDKKYMSLQQFVQKSPRAGNKRMRENEIADNVVIRGQQNFENF